MPRDEILYARHTCRVSEVENLIARIDEFLAANPSLSDRSLSQQATTSVDTIRNIRRNRLLPKERNLSGLAAYMGLTNDQLLGRTPAAEGGAMPPPLFPRSNAQASGLSDVTRGFRGAPTTLPVVGTGHCADFQADVDGRTVQIEQYSFDPDHIEAHVARPAVLIGVREAYAIIPVGDSMYPRFGPGELQVADPRLPPRIGDDVVVQLGNGDGNVTAVLIKRLVRRSGTFVELEQFNPPQRFRVDMMQVVRIHRLLTQRELLGF